MHLLTSGRPAFLEFLRNLTPQILLISLSAILWYRLDFSHFDINNWKNTLGFYAVALVSILAFIANTLQFMENASLSTEWVEKAALKIKRIVKTPRGRMYSLLRIVFKKKPSVLLELFLAAIVLYAGVLIAANMAISSAITILKATGV